MEYFKKLHRYRRVKRAMKNIYLRNLCPSCNSDAPEIDDCPVCFGNREYPIPPKVATSMAVIYLSAVALEQTLEQAQRREGE